MKEFKGTPGPWRVGSETISGDIRVIDMGGSMVAMAEAKTGDGYLWSPSTVAENANLIAASPELLEALQDALHAYDKHGEHSEWDFARAAIAKALGESQ